VPPLGGGVVERYFTTPSSPPLSRALGHPSSCEEGRRGVERLADHREHTFKVVHHVAVLEAQNANPRLREKRVTTRIAGLGSGVIVRCAIQFDREASARTIEVEDVWSGAVLSAELPTAELTALEMRPQPRFRRGQ